MLDANAGCHALAHSRMQKHARDWLWKQSLIILALRDRHRVKTSVPIAQKKHFDQWQGRECQGQKGCRFT